MQCVGTKEASERLGVTQQHISRLCRNGAFPHAFQAWDAHPWHIPVEDLLEFDRNRKKQEASAADRPGEEK